MVNVIARIGFILINVLFIFLTVKTFCKRTKLGNNLGRALLLIYLILWAYTVNNYCHDGKFSEYLVGLEHILTGWALLSLLLFAYAFTEREIKAGYRACFGALVLVDTVILFTNPINHYAGGYAVREKGELSYTYMTPNLLYYYHIFVCCLLIFFVYYTMLRRVVVTSKYYRLKYDAILIVLTLSIVLNALFTLNREMFFDLSKLAFMFGILFMYGCVYLFKPIGLMPKLRRYVDDNISDATALYDCDGKLLDMNDSGKRLFDGKDFSTVDKMMDIIGNPPVGKSMYVSDNPATKKAYEVIYTPIHDEKNYLVSTVFIFHDATETERQLKKEHHIATFDQLTGSYNRLGFLEEAEKYIKKHGSEGAYALIISGINNFKGFNSLYGTRSGDIALKEIASIYHNYHHEFPMIYGRTAEGKFGCIVPIEYVDAIVNALSSIPLKIGDDTEVKIEMSHGFVLMRDLSQSVSHYYELALLALARCKKSSKVQLLEYTQSMEDEQHRKQLLLTEMRDAIEKNEFFIEIQPQIDLKTNRVSGGEALVRWHHPSLGRIAPGDFVPLFESNGFITELDQFVWEQAAKTIAYFEENGIFAGPLSVNVSQVDIESIDVPAKLAEIVDKYDIMPSKLHIEITESACAENRYSLIRTLKELRAKGFIVEIDDFGSGYSSLNALMDIPFDVVKLDMVFMKDSNFDEKSDIIIGAVADMIHKLGAKIIAEGVENDENVVRALSYGVDVAQGYYYSKPISISSFEVFARSF